MVVNSFWVMVRVRVEIMVYVKPFCSAENFWASDVERFIKLKI